MRILFGFLFFVCSLSSKSQLLSPDAFLGYPLGSKYTYHWQLVNYFEHVAKNVPDRVTLVKYGTSYEGRPLIAAIVSDKENIAQAEYIRMNNLRLARMTRDKMAPTEEGPVTVWLSYNVHGNEASSSEASMQTLYQLAQPDNPAVHEWLKQTVVIIDPCLNPDGRDRYVQWYQSVQGHQPNPVRMAREHHEPWPGGRTNHYYFDLNRDWAWQTQQETRQRLQLYNQWLPQVHVDYHEQGINEPYYFAPAAEPYHEVITPWQRIFQDSIGRNHARYFDQKGWLYFTRLRFDLLYPSYGDTYPTYNGAIGMTYEQAGIGAGLAVVTDEGDTLTLTDRIAHHVTTAMSTIETSSKQRTKLISEYKNFFAKAVSSGYGPYAAYVIKNRKGDGQRLSELKDLLDKNGIRYGTAQGAYNGYDYTTGREAAFSVSEGDVVISAIQPKSALLYVLMEPNAKLSDSVTYDITAWSLPYAFGLQAYAVKSRINTLAYTDKPVGQKGNKEAYGYVIKWEGVKSAGAAAALLAEGVALRYNEVPFVSGGQTFESGSIIVLPDGNRNVSGSLPDIVSGICDSLNVSMFPVYSGMADNGVDFGSDLVHRMAPKRVTVASGPGVSSNALGAVWHFFEQELHYPVSLVNTNELTESNLEKTDILILPDGYYAMLTDKNETESLNNWIRKGGRLIAMESAVSALSKTEWGLKPKKSDDPDDKKDTYALLKSYSQREREYMKSITPGSVYKVTLDHTHPLAFGYSDTYFTLKQNDQIYDYIAGNGWNVGVLKKEAQMAGFVGANLKTKLYDGLLIGVQNIGKGTVVSFTDDIIFRNFWQNGKLMLCNAVFFDF
jgi:hypothetical protein